MVWSPDGKEIAYLCGAELCLVKSDGANSRKLTSLPDGNPYGFRWSPDGRILRFWTDDDKRTSLWEISANGANLHQLLERWDHDPRLCCGHWTPDGKYFIFQSYPFPFGPVRIWVIGEKRGFLGKASEPVLLTETPLDVHGAVPSRDGKRLFLNGYVGRMELVRYNATSRQFVPYLGGIPLEKTIREEADAGAPVVVSQPDTAGAKAFREVASAVAARVSVQSFRQLPVINVR